MHKKPILILLLIFAIATAALIYLNNVFLPIKLKEIICRELSKKLNRNVTVESLYYIPFKGLIFKNVAIQKKPPQTESILSIKEVAVSIFYLPLFSHQKIIIPSLVLDQPTLVLSFEQTGVWNFQDLLTPPNTGKAPKGQEKYPLLIYVAGVTVVDGTVVIFDKNTSSEPIETLNNIGIRASLALPKNMKATIKIFPKKPGALKLFADFNYDFMSRDFLCQLRAENLSFEKLTPYINKSGLNLQKAKLNTASFDLSRRQKKISGKGELLFDQIKMQLPDKTTIQAFPSLTLKEITLENNILSAKGLVDIKEGEFILENDKKISTNISYDFVASKNEGKITAEGKVSAPNLIGQFTEDMTFAAQPQGKANFVYYDGILEAQAQLTLQNAKVTFKPDTQVTDNPVLDFSLIFNPQGEKNTRMSYSTTISFVNGQAVNLPFLKTLDNISGKLLFEPNKITADSLAASVNQAPVTLSGFVENFKKPFVDISLSANNLDLSTFKTSLSQYLKQDDIDIKGTANLKLRYKGRLSKATGALVKCSLSLKDAAFKNKFVKDGLSNISGDLFYAVEHFDPSYFLPDKATWKNLRLTHQDKNYVLNGSLQYNNLLSTLQQGDLSVSLTSKIFPDRFNILALNAQYKGSQASAQGEVVYPRNKENMKINIKATSSLYLQDLPEVIPALKEKLGGASPKGLCLAEILFVGNPNEWRDWAFVINLSSDEISLYNYKLNKVFFKYAQRDRFINECTLSSIFYDGTIALEGSSDLSINEMPYKLNIDIKNIDLAKLKNDSPLKDKDLSGFISGSYTGTGPLSAPRLSQGQGFLSVKDGKLWRFEVLKGLGQMLFVSDQQDITLDSAEGNFSVINEKVVIKDGLIKGNQVELSCNGNIAFNGDLDLDIVSRFGEGVIKSSQSLQKTVAAFLSQAEDFLTVKITGTIKEPQYKIIPPSMNVIQKAKDFLFDALPNIFQ